MSDINIENEQLEQFIIEDDNYCRCCSENCEDCSIYQTNLYNNELYETN